MSVQFRIPSAVAVERILMHIELQPEGGSCDSRTGELLTFSDGYLVGGAHPESVLLWPNHKPLKNARPFVNHIVQAARAMTGTPVMVGWWTDDDVLYVEVSQHVRTEAAAFRIAQKRGELAFFDVANGKDVRL